MYTPWTWGEDETRPDHLFVEFGLERLGDVALEQVDLQDGADFSGEAISGLRGAQQYLPGAPDAGQLGLNELCELDGIGLLPCWWLWAVPAHRAGGALQRFCTCASPAACRVRGHKLKLQIRMYGPPTHCQARICQLSDSSCSPQPAALLGSESRGRPCRCAGMRMMSQVTQYFHEQRN